MDKEEAERIINQILKEADEFREEPTYMRALQLDKDITILRFIIGEANFLPLDYFRRTHEAAVKYIDEHDKAKERA